MAKVDFDRSYGVQAVLFDASISPYSPVIGDVERCVSFDEDGKEIVSWKEVDYKELQKSRPCVEDFSLNAMLKAGINPAFSIHTGSGVSRVEGVEAVNEASADVEQIFKDSE